MPNFQLLCGGFNDNNNNLTERHNLRFFTISSLHHEPSPDTYAQVAQAQLCANQAQHIERLSHATCRFTCHLVRRTAQLLSLTEFKSHLFELYFVGWTINWWRMGGNRSTRRKPLMTSSENHTYLSPKIQAPSETQTRTVALVAS